MGKDTTSDASNRSVKNDNQELFVATNPMLDYRLNNPTTLPTVDASGNISYQSANQSTADRKIPVIELKGRDERVTKFLSPSTSAEQVRRRTEKYKFINSKIKLKDPNTGKFVEYKGYYVAKQSSGGGGGGDPTPPTPDKIPPIPPGKPGEYEWNLPPHKWSLPTVPEQVNDLQPGRSSVTDKYRRGRIWWKANPDIEVFDKNQKKSKIGKGDATRKYGFQFLWNPETFGTQVSVQLEATPNQNDRFIGVAGAFPATETISFNIRLDRTNDFACAAAKFGRPSRVKRVKPKAGADNFISAGEVSDLAGFYNYDGVFSIGDTELKLVDLFERGTLADIEYLYKAINGPGPGNNQSWVNGRGIETADIGFLMPTLLHVDIGPLSYDGYVTALNINHIMFTREMIPIRSDVTISLNLLATVGITSETAESGGA